MEEGSSIGTYGRTFFRTKHFQTITHTEEGSSVSEKRFLSSHGFSEKQSLLP